jgi:pimeloyl-ACP methyl ester carboxylesterase
MHPASRAVTCVLFGWLLLATCSGLQTTPAPATPSAVLVTTAPDAAPTAAPPSRLALEACALGNGVSAHCGTLRVPEDRLTRSGRTIGLHVAVIRASATPRAPDPIFFLSGGPGGVASEDFVWTATALADLNRTRDFVLVDQRGVGTSNPLICPNPGFEIKDVLTADGEQLLSAYVGHCLQELPGDPSFYTSDAAADDLDDVRAALGYETINLYGGSYGATLAQYYAIQHPERLRTMFLEGASLLGVHMRERWPVTRHEALHKLFAACAGDAQCNERYPNLQKAFETVLARVSESPVRTAITTAAGKPIVIDRLTLYLFINGMLLTTDGQRALPALIYAAYEHDSYSAIALAYREIGGEARASMVQVMAWSILCTEDWARADVAAVAQAARGAYFAEESVLEARAYAVACSYLPAGRLPKEHASRISTDVPTVFRVGELDPQDPLEHIATRATDVPNHLAVVFPGEAHGVSDEADACRFGILTAFVASGSVTGLDTGCAVRHEPPPFE